MPTTRDSDEERSARIDRLVGQPTAHRSGAYDLYLARHREPGHDVDDWLQAERELRNATRCAVA